MPKRTKPVRRGKRTRTRSAAARDLLVEILTEELPPKSLAQLAAVFAAQVLTGLKAQGFATEQSRAETFATPRRLAVTVSRVRAKQEPRLVERKGPAVKSGFDANGEPTPALLGFARACGVAPKVLNRRESDKGEYFFYQARQTGERIGQYLAQIVEAAAKRLPVAKLMRWGAGEVQFVRPVHGLILLHGNKIIAGQVLGLESGNATRGHRFLSKGLVSVPQARRYETVLERRGMVIVSLERRVQLIEQQLDRAAKRLRAGTHWRVGDVAVVLEEVASLVEYPAVYAGSFSGDFLKLPKECLILSMQQHQRYFPLENHQGKLLAHFLFVSNIKTKAPQHIIQGNERVLRARLSDAKFFYDQDRKVTLAARVPRLAHVVYHSKLGSQLERVERIRPLVTHIARKLKLDAVAADTAATLCKADLLTEMVGEFPELQGVMGYYYATHEGIAEPIAQAIKSHYLPRGANDLLPMDDIGACVALADKLDAVVGLYGIGLIPTGEKDLFGVRRHALGALRILIEQSRRLDLVELLQLARQHFPPRVLSDEVVRDVHHFMLERLRTYLRDKNFLPDEIEAVLGLNPTRMDQILPRLQALQQFRARPEGQALAAANKRIRNILRQAGGAPATEIRQDLLADPAEQELARQVRQLRAEIQPLVEAGDYETTLKRLASLRPAVDRFFEQVLVMVEEESVRNQRLALLNRLSELFLTVADVSRLQG